MGLSSGVTGVLKERTPHEKTGAQTEHHVKMKGR